MDLADKIDQDSFEKNKGFHFFSLHNLFSFLPLKESQQLEDSSRQEDRKINESGEQRSPDPFKSEENKKDENRETIEDKLSYDVGTIFFFFEFFCFEYNEFFIFEYILNFFI